MTVTTVNAFCPAELAEVVASSSEHMPDTNGLKHAVILSGGGADGAYEIGVLKALFNGRSPSTNKTPIEPEIFCGTSVGAFNAAFLVSHWKNRGTAAISDLEDVWRNYLTANPSTSHYGVFRIRMNPLEVLDPRSYFPNPFKPFTQLANDSVRLAADGFQRAFALVAGRDASLIERVLETLNVSSLIDLSPLERTINRWIDFSEIREEGARTLRIAATNWATGEPKIFHNYEMTDKLGLQAIMASTAIPGIFPQVKVGAQPFVDGGLVLNAPLELAIEAGADVIHVIYLSADVKKMPLAQMENTMTTLLRQQFIAWARQYYLDIEIVRATNKKKRLLESLEDQLTEEQANDLVQAVPTARKEPMGRNKYKELIVHRYYPHESLSGTLGLLDFSRGSIEERIERGFNDASNYDPWVNQAVGVLDPEEAEKLERQMIHGLREGQ